MISELDMRDPLSLQGCFFVFKHSLICPPFCLCESFFLRERLQSLAFCCLFISSGIRICSLHSFHVHRAKASFVCVNFTGNTIFLFIWEEMKVEKYRIGLSHKNFRIFKKRLGFDGLRIFFFLSLDSTYLFFLRLVWIFSF